MISKWKEQADMEKAAKSPSKRSETITIKSKSTDLPWQNSEPVPDTIEYTMP